MIKGLSISRISIILLFALFTTSSLYATECGTAASTTCGAIETGTTTGDPSTGTGEGTCGTSDGTAGTMWYTFIGNGSTWTAETVATAGQYDTKIWVFSGACGALTCVTGNDDGGTGTLSLVNFATTVGVTYYIVVGGFSGNTGNYQLNVSSAGPCTSECVNAATVSCGTVENGNTTGETVSGLGTCGTSAGTGGVVWYTFTGDGNSWSFETTAASYDTKIWVYSGVCGALACVTGNDDGGVGTLSLVNFTATLGVTYYIVVGGFAANEGTFTLDISSTPCGAAPGVGPGGVSSGLQIWLKAELGTTGNNPVTSWANQGPNASITQVVSTIGTVIQSGVNHNFNNGIRMAGGANYKNGIFSAGVANRSTLIPGNEISMFTVYSDGGYDLSMSFHSLGNSANQWHGFCFRHGGLGTLYSAGGGMLYNTPTNRSTNILGMRGTASSSGVNSFNGIQNTTGNVGAFTTSTAAFDFCIGLWPGYANNNITSENIVFDRDLSAVEYQKVESYLAIKYGVTLGTNGTSLDYNLSDNSVVWDQSSNSAYAFDIAGIARDDNSLLSQLKSHSVNGTSYGLFDDIVTISNGTNFATPSALAVDMASFMWGHNGGPTVNTGVVVNYPTDNSETIETIFQRVWKSEEIGTVGTLTLEFDLSTVIGVGGVTGVNDLANLRLLVDEDADFTNGATSISPSSYNNVTGIAYFQHNFQPFSVSQMTQLRGFFFTLGSTSVATTPLPVLLSNFDVDNEDCSNLIEWTTSAELNSAFFTIERSYNMQDWEEIAKVTGAENSSTSLDYIWRDNSFTKNGAVYYRLTQEDVDGATTVLQVKSVNCFCEENVEPVLYPNPASNVLMVESSSPGKLYLVDIRGKEVAVQDILEGQTSIAISKVAAGTYLARIQLDNDKSFVYRFVKL